MTKFEFIQEVALRMLKACPAIEDNQYIAEKAADLAEEVWKYENKKLPVMDCVEEFPYKEKADLREEVENFRGMKNYHVTPVVEALTTDVKTVNLSCAKGLSLFYGRIDIDHIRDALSAGEIEGRIPKKKTIQLMQWDYKTQTRVPDKKREQCVGEYAVDKASLLMWLDAHYMRIPMKGTMIFKYIAKIINQKK